MPGEDEILVEVPRDHRHWADCATRDANRRSGLLRFTDSRLVFGLRRPKQRILGSEFAGEVEVRSAGAVRRSRSATGSSARPA